MLEQELESNYNKHLSFTPILWGLIKSLLESHDINFHVVEQRTKEVSSLKDKIARKKLTDISQIKDFTGIRIILYYQDDIDKVDSIIRNNFKVDDANSIDKANILESNEFGYLSVHYIVNLDNKRNTLPEWMNYATLNAEIQVRTVLQHSWASISHELSYKRKIEIPKELSRKLFRLAGLFELADEQFLSIRDEHDKLENNIQSISKLDRFLNQKINALTVKEFISKEDSLFKEIELIAVRAGFESRGVPIKNVSDIILILELMGIETLKQFKTVISDNISDYQSFFETLKSHDSPWSGDVDFFTQLALLYNSTIKQRENFWRVTNSSWSKDVIEQINNAIKKTKL